MQYLWDLFSIFIFIFIIINLLFIFKDVLLVLDDNVDEERE